MTGEACLILCVYLSINSRHLTALIGSEPGAGQPGLGGRWPAADFWPMRWQYCDHVMGLSQSERSIVTEVTNQVPADTGLLSLSRPRII